MDESQLKKNRPLAPLTTIGMGGPAQFFLEVDSTETLKDALRLAKARNLPYLVLGGGSNLLLPDEGFPGLVLHMNVPGIDVEQKGDHIRLKISAGEDWDQLVAQTVAEGWAGLECMSGIPGKAGAAPIQNIGAYGRELAELLTSVQVLNTETLEEQTLSNQDCGFSYRHSIFKGSARGKFLVTAITLKLRENGRPIIRYPDLVRRLPPDAGLAEVRDTVLAVRRSKSMVVDPRDPNSRSCGSFFTNPILSEADYRKFAASAPPEHPHFPAGEGHVKLSAAWLIDHSGFHKGYIKGGVGLSRNHCLALINRGQGTAAEIKALMKEIQESVAAKFGIHMEPEPVII